MDCRFAFRGRWVSVKRLLARRVSVGFVLATVAIGLALASPLLAQARHTAWFPARTGTPAVDATQPTFNPAGGTYYNSRRITITFSVAGAKIHYTTNGTDPTASSPLYSSPISITTTTTLKARALVGTSSWSAVRTAVYNIRYSPPSFSPSPGTYNTAKVVKMAHATVGAKVYYTTNGTLPTISSNLYTSGITVNTTTTFTARALIGGTIWSPQKTATYNIRYSAPYFTPSGGTYTTPKSMTMTHNVPGAVIYYTTDGSEPTTASRLYSSRIYINQTTTLKARALILGTMWGSTKTATYTINLPKPIFSLSGGTYYGSKRVVMTFPPNTGFVSIYYTTDGSEPTTASNLYTVSVGIDTTMTLRARARINSAAWSAETSATYRIRYYAPRFSSYGGTYTSTKYVTMTPANTGSSIYYTLDGHEPTSGDRRYTTAVLVAGTLTLKARELVHGSVWSPMTTASFTLNLPAPTFTPGGGTYWGARGVKIEYGSMPGGSHIYYTTDGSFPTRDSHLYTFGSMVGITTTTTLKARAFVADTTWGDVKTATYNIRHYPPTISPSGGTYSTVQTVTVTPRTSGVVYYTTDGSLPTTASTQYCQRLVIDESVTLTARGLIDGSVWTPANIQTYTINLPAPAISPSGGSYPPGKVVTISSTIPGAQIYYTMNGSEPTTESALYTDALTLTSSVTIRARALVNGHAWSATKVAPITIQGVTPV
jgi:hypothetical protein